MSGNLLRRSNSTQRSQAYSSHESIRKVFVIFGGDTSERQVSLMSGTNVWLNLQVFDEVSYQFLSKLKARVLKSLYDLVSFEFYILCISHGFEAEH